MVDFLYHPYLRSADGDVHLEVAAHEDAEGDTVDEHEEDDIAEAESALRLEREADGELSVVGDADEREGGHDEAEGPGDDHDVGGVLEAEALVEVHGVRDGVVTLQGDDGKGEDRQLGGQHAEEAGGLAGARQLPLDRVLAELAQGRGVEDREETWNRSFQL